MEKETPARVPDKGDSETVPGLPKGSAPPSRSACSGYLNLFLGEIQIAL
jgi:hypothetical protein